MIQILRRLTLILTLLLAGCGKGLIEGKYVFKDSDQLVHLKVSKNSSGSVVFYITSSDGARFVEIGSDEIYKKDDLYYFVFEDNFGVRGCGVASFRDGSVWLHLVAEPNAKGPTVAHYREFVMQSDK